MTFAQAPGYTGQVVFRSLLSKEREVCWQLYLRIQSAHNFSPYLLLKQGLNLQCAALFFLIFFIKIEKLDSYQARYSLLFVCSV